MAEKSDFRFCEDTGYVDIHGRDVKVVVCQKTGRILVPIDELREIGFRIYRKNQYHRLLIDDSQFTHEFHLFLLECAQTYMLKNKISFKENEILESINKCKKLLTESHNADKKSVPPANFLSNHVVESSGDSNINIRVKPEPTTPVTNHLSSHDSRFKANHNPERKDGFVKPSDRRNQRQSYSFEQNSVNSDNSDDNRRQSSGDFRRFARPKNSMPSPSPVSSPPKNQNNRDSDSQDGEAKRLENVQLTKPVHDVVVSHVDDNGVWVQPIENAKILIEIDEKIQAEVANAEVVSRSAFNNVYLAQDEGAWYRCKPIKFKPLTIFFIDYGNTAQVNVSDLRETSPALAAIPGQAVRIVFDDAATKPQVGEMITIRVVKRGERGSYRVEIVPKETEKKPDRPITVPSVVKIKINTYFNKPQPLCTLQNGQKVMLINEIDGKFILRTKECYDKLKQIEQVLESAIAEPMHEKVEKGQLVLCNKDNKLCRAQIMKVDGESAEVELLDYGDKFKVNVTSFKNITESLSREPMTFITSPHLKDFKGFNDKEKELIQQLIRDRIKPTVVLKDGDFDLKLTDGLLSDKLKSLKETSDDRLMFSDLKLYKPPMGKGSYMLYALRDSDNVTLVSTEELEKYIEDVVRSDVDSEPYTPVLGEVCYGFYQDNWSRCVITRVLTNRFEVHFIDFGNVEILKGEHLRKVPAEGVRNTPILGVPCRFVGLPPLKNITELLQEHFEDGEVYALNVKKYNDQEECFEIEAADFYKVLRGE